MVCHTAVIALGQIKNTEDKTAEWDNTWLSQKPSSTFPLSFCIGFKALSTYKLDRTISYP